MWGNRLGWGIAAAIALVFLGLAWLIIRAGEPSRPTAFSQSDPILNQPLALPVDPSTIVPMNEPGVAGPLYRKALDDYLADPRRYDPRAGQLNAGRLLPGHQAILDATHLAQMNLFAEQPQDAISYRSDVEKLDALRAVAESLMHLALLNQKDNPARARTYYQAAFALGAKLFQERVSYAEMSTGLGLMTGNALQLQKLAKGEEAERLQRFHDETLAYSRALSEIMSKISRLDDPKSRTAYRYVGDIYAIARSPRMDRVWRVEALLKIGQYKYNTRRKGDQLNALPTLRSFLNDPDPAIQTAAKMAHDLDQRSYNLLGG